MNVSRFTHAIVVTTAFIGSTAVRAGPTVEFVRGDSNSDGQVDIGDAISILNMLFVFDNGGVRCLNAANADAVNGLNISDAIRIFAFLFQGLVPPDGPPVGGVAGRYGAEHCGPLNPGDVDLGCDQPSATCAP